jgi:AraC family transcriptional activator FtrA
MAERAGMSKRTFQRRFRDLTGSSPGEFLLARRLRRACDLLERQATISVDDVALAAGFATPATLRHHFRSRLSTSPAAYRSRFRHVD